MGSAIGSIAGAIAGGGGGSAPTASYGTQIGNANNTYATATSDAAQTLNTAQAYNTNAQNTLQNVVGQQTPEMATVNNSANQNLQTYGSTFTPLQQQQAQMAQNYTSAANTQLREGQAVADSNSGVQASLANQRAALASEGVDPASIGGSALTQQAAVMGGAQAAQAGTQSYLNTQAQGQNLISQANQLGLQVGSLGTGQATAGSSIGSQAVANTNSTNSSGISNLTAANQYLNTGVNANQSSANITNQQFQNNQTSYQDQQQQAASTGALVGNIVGGVASGFLQDGGPVTEKGALPNPVIPGTTDRKIVALTPGEFVIPRDVAQHMGHDKLHKLIDKTREDISMRHGIPPRPTSAFSSV